MLCCVFCIFFLIVYSKFEIKFLCFRLEFNAAFIVLAPKSFTQGLKPMSKPIQPVVAVLPPYLSSRSFLPDASSLCTAIRLISLSLLKTPLSKKWFVCSYFSLLKWCGRGSGVIAPPGAGMGWLRGGQHAGCLRPQWSYQSHWMNLKSVIPVKSTETVPRMLILIK